MTKNESPSHDELFAALENVSLAEARSFRRRLKKARAPKALQEIDAEIHAAAERVALTDAAVPTISYPDALPVTARKDDIAEAIRDNQVVIIAGETGSGKTTQIPKICLELGRGRRGFIGHTQPRRIAARTVAEPIAAELDQKIGESVGYAIRFDDRVSETTAVKLMTDGILLAEMQRDRFLNKYDTIIIDEAHERSLNIDFLLGYLKRLLPKRPDLKVIITSATIDPESFAAHFADADGNPAPIIEVSGRTYPVEIRYRPLEFEAGGKVVDQDPLDGLTEAIDLTKSSTACLASTAAAASSWPPISPKPRLPCPASAMSSIPAPPVSRGIPRAPRSSGCLSSLSRRPPPTSAPAAAAALPMASPFASIANRTLKAAPNSPTQKFCAPTSPASSCRWSRSS